jgi:putative flavoprotein involved in K+ transport
VLESFDVVVVGAGQAGLSLSHEMSEGSIDHVVLERGHIGESWRRRWDSFCLVLPNWTVQLPGHRYSGGDPDAFMQRDEIVAHLAAYAESFRAPVREGVEVHSLERQDDGRFLLRTSDGEVRARQVVLASGAFQKPYRPTGSGTFPDSLDVIDAGTYTNPVALGPGAVLVVGSGQTGCQIAEELAEFGRDVYLACGRAPWIHRQITDREDHLVDR